jgi:thiol-disulfide isomerase/thioredoxin
MGCSFAAAGVLLAGASVAVAQQPPKNLIVNEAPPWVGGLQFEDGQNRARSLTDFRGKVVLLNIWATWCTPCRNEIPALDHLDAALDGGEFTILAVSIDHRGIEAVRKLFGDLGVRTLAMYVDSSGQAMRAAHVIGLPTSLIIDREGRELARIVGPVEWDAAATVEYLRHVVSTQSREGGSARAEAPADARPADREATPGEPPGRSAMRDQRSAP